MKISEVITDLTLIMGEVGDIPMQIGFVEVTDVWFYPTKNGVQPVGDWRVPDATEVQIEFKSPTDVSDNPKTINQPAISES